MQAQLIPEIRRQLNLILGISDFNWTCTTNDFENNRTIIILNESKFTPTTPNLSEKLNQLKKIVELFKNKGWHSPRIFSNQQEPSKRSGCLIINFMEVFEKCIVTNVPAQQPTASSNSNSSSSNLVTSKKGVKY